MDEIMTLEEVAKYLKLKPQTIYNWAQNHKIPAAKLVRNGALKKPSSTNGSTIILTKSSRIIFSD